MWHTDDPVEVPEDPDKRFVDYEQGSRLAVPVETVANYFSNVYQYYMSGGFTDDLGRFHKGYNYSFDWIEVLNEPDFEHGILPSNYIKLYDGERAPDKRLGVLPVPDPSCLPLCLFQPS